MALHHPSIAAYMLPTTSLRLSVWQALKARHPLYIMKSVVRSQDGRMRPWEVFTPSFAPLIIPLWLCSPWRCTEWWVVRCVYDRSGLLSSSHLLWSPCVSCCGGARRAASLAVNAPRNIHAVLWLKDVAWVKHPNTESFSLCDTQIHLSSPLLSPCLSISSASHFLILFPSPSVSINHSWAAPAD